MNYSERTDLELWQKQAYAKVEKMPQKAREIRERAKEDLFFFAQLMNPGYMYGQIHKDIFRWMQDYSLFGQDEFSTSNKLIMLPRAHLKSHMVAVWCAWIITRHPEITILYVSATAELAETQLFAIKNIMGGSRYSRYFPEYIHPQEGKRARWSTTKMTVDHIERKDQGVRDSTIATAGLTTNTTGWHADIIVADDLVVPENAYTEEGRESVVKKASQFTSIRNAGGFTMACGTRYHPSDIYATWKKQVYDIYNEDMEVMERKRIWEIKEYAVEEDGVFIWPRVVRPTDNKAFGFDPNTLSRIKGEYEDRVQFYAQYYNDPNDPGSERITADKFQYFDHKYVKKEFGNWYYKDKRLNVYASVDFAYTVNKASDYTAIVVIGIDSDSNIYVLDIERFKTDRIIEIFKKIKIMHSRWNFKKIRAEVTAAQQMIVNDIKDYVRQEGLTLSVEEYRPIKKEGSKEERMAATLEHRYENLKMWHYQGGYTPVLEEELIQARPAHDDIKDALASAIGIAVKPKASRSESGTGLDMFKSNVKINSRFGGVAF